MAHGRGKRNKQQREADAADAKRKREQQIERVIPFDAADYLEGGRQGIYPDGKLVLDDGTMVDLNAPSIFDDPPKSSGS